MAEVEEKVILTADASQLTATFDQLVNAITQTREELRQYKDDKEKSAELTKRLADQEMQLVELMKKNNNVINTSNVSYKQLNDILKDLNKTYRSTSDAAQRMNIAPASKAINQELKTMDANIGQYQRNIGNYANDVEKAFASVRMNATQVMRELPSLKYGIEMFFVAISNNLPMLIESLERLKAARAAEKAASAEQVAMDTAENKAKQGLAGSTAALGAAKAGAANASVTEKNTELELAKAEVEENQVTLQAVEADMEAIKASKAKVEANLKEMKTVMALAEEEKYRASISRDPAAMKAASEAEFRANETYKQLLADLEKIEIQEVETKEALVTATNNLTAAQERLNKAMAEGDVESAGGAAEGAAKSMGKLSNIVILVVTILALFWRQISEGIDSLINFGKRLQRSNEILEETKKAVDPKEMSEFNGEVQKTTRSLMAMQTTLVNSANGARLFYKEQLELNKAVMEGAKSMAQEYVEIRLLDSIISDAAKSEEDHNKAAEKLVKILDDAAISTKDVKDQTEAYKKSVDKLIESLYNQAQAQGAIQLLQAKFTDTVLKAQGELIDAELAQEKNKFQNFGQWLEYWAVAALTPLGLFSDKYKSKKDFLDAKVEKWKKQLDVAKTEFEQFLAKITEMFSFDDLFGGENGGGGGGADNWFSKWEMWIKRVETLQGTFVGEFQNLNLAETWKYSQAGMEAYMKKFDEYTAHYKNDVKQLKEIEIQRLQYIEERYQYQQKLIKQYQSSDKSEKERDLASLEEWFTQMKLVYKTAGVDIEGLVNEYNKRLSDIQHKYIDQYVNVGKDGMELELANLQVAFEKELYEYQKKGIETVNLEEHFAQERLKIISKYAKEEADAVIEQIQRQEDARRRMNEVSLGWNNQGGSNRIQELQYAKLGGTTMTGHQTRQNEIEATFNDYNIYKESADAQIAEMERVLASGKLIGQQKLEMEQQLEDAKQELALTTAEYEMSLNQMVLEDTRQTTEEMLSYIQSSFQGLGGMFDDVYTAIEKTTELQVKQGKLSEKEAEKRLEEYRGVKAAAAAMDALASAVGAYNSLASIPYVGPVLGAAAAAAALAAGFANVRLIMATTKDNAGQATDSYATAAPSLSDYVPSYVSNITGKSDIDYLNGSLKEEPIHCFITESEVTAAQEVANKRAGEVTW